jgi:hypothetical protein
MPVGRIGMGMDAAGWAFSAMVDAGCECSAAFKRQWRDGRQLRGVRWCCVLRGRKTGSVVIFGDC